MNFFKKKLSIFGKSAAKEAEKAAEEVIEDVTKAAEAPVAAPAADATPDPVPAATREAEPAAAPAEPEADAGTRGEAGEGLSFAQQSEQAIPATVRMFSGCKDSQTSADVHDVASFQLPADAGPGGAGGACTNAMLGALLGEGGDSLTWASLLEQMRKTLSEKRFTQVPQLSSSRELRLDTPFSVDGGGGGKKRALMIGINYVGQQGELRGCHNDVIAMKQYIETHGYEGAEIRVLMDDGEHDNPTMQAMVDGFAWLTEGASAGDSLFFHYSGHGGSVRDKNNDEKDGKDETLIPLDYQSAGQLTDDLILANLVLELPADVTLTAVIDACHSGTVLDLPYTLIADGDTMESVNSGGISVLPQNGAFNFAQLLRIGKMLWDMHQKGATKEQIMQKAFQELHKSGAMGAATQAMATLGSLAG